MYTMIQLNALSLLYLLKLKTYLQFVTIMDIYISCNLL
jgi:hypothetical protein